MEPTERAEVEEAVGRELAPFGLRGTIALRGTSIELQAGGPPVSIEIDVILKQWPLLPGEMRQRKAEEIARRLVGAHRASGGPRPADRAPEGPPRTRIAGAIGGLLSLLVVLGLVRFLAPRFVSQEKPDAGTPREADAERRQRLGRACDAMRDRIYQGASPGPFATEGWVAEIWLASRKGGTLKDHAALTAMLANGKLTAAADDELAQVSDGAAEIADGFGEEAGRRSPAWGGAIIALREGYARAFFDAEKRPRFIALADRLAAASGAELGALYGRCAHLATHDVGVWFRGADGPGAAAALLYQMGLFAEQPTLNRGAVAAIAEPGGELDSLRKAAGDVNADLLPSLLTSQGGSVGTARGVAVTFPMGGPTRAITATRELARKLKIGVGSP